MFATRVPILWTTRLRSLLRLVYICLFSHNNPILWALRERRWNQQSDLEGPYYVLGAPDRTIAPGKAVMASLSELHEAHAPFLLRLRVLTSAGVPWPDALVDFWQANSEGKYDFEAYSLRGTSRTDMNGVLEILTVPPGRYGPHSAMRTAHFHIRVRAPPHPASGFATLTTQAYVCRANDPGQMATDFANYFRLPRAVNMLFASCVPSSKPVQSTSSTPASKGSTHFLDLPAFDPATEPVLAKSVAWWNNALNNRDIELTVGVMGSKEISLTSTF